jgi:hypothetical protein
MEHFQRRNFEFGVAQYMICAKIESITQNRGGILKIGQFFTLRLVVSISSLLNGEDIVTAKTRTHIERYKQICEIARVQQNIQHYAKYYGLRMELFTSPSYRFVFREEFEEYPF